MICAKAAVLFFLVVQIDGIFGAAAIVKESRSLAENCEGIVNPICLKLNFLSFIEKISFPSEFDVYPGISLVSKGIQDVADTKLQQSSRGFSDETEKEVDAQLTQKLSNILDSYSVNLKLADDETSRSFEEEYEEVAEDGRKMKKRRRRTMGLVLLGLALVKKIIGAVMIFGLFLLAKKAILLSILSLFGTVLMGIKLKKYEKEAEAALIPQYGVPAYTDHVHYGFNGYARNLNIDLPENLKKVE